MNNKVLKSFHYLESGDVVYSESKTLKSSNKLDAGVYTLNYAFHPTHQPVIKVMPINENLEVPFFKDKDLLDHLFDLFFQKEYQDTMRDLGFLLKVGVLLYGKEGTGKSSIFKYYINHAVKKHNAIVFYISSMETYEMEAMWRLLMSLRETQDNTFIIVFEEFDEFVRKTESLIKNITDGNLSINNTILLANTNHIQDIPSTIKDRKSRFKYTIEIGTMVDKDAIYNIVDNILKDKFTEEEKMNFVKELNNQTLDYIKHFCIDKLTNTKIIENKKKIGFF